jgi:hypothetical protein
MEYASSTLLQLLSRIYRAASDFSVIKHRLVQSSLFGWLVADGWCWFVLREK